MKKKLCMLLLTLITIPSLHAASVVKEINVNTKLNNSCSLAVSDVVFGTYNPTANIDHTTTQNITIRCTKGTPWNFYEYAVYYSYAGATNSTGYASAMLFNGNKLYYQVQMSDGVWDNDVDMGGRPNSGHFVGTGNGQNQNLTLNFRIIKNQFVAQGNYVDTATAYISF